jgi:hypothetical protein
MDVAGALLVQLAHSHDNDKVRLQDGEPQLEVAGTRASRYALDNVRHNGEAVTGSFVRPRASDGEQWKGLGPISPTHFRRMQPRSVSFCWAVRVPDLFLSS